MARTARFADGFWFRAAEESVRALAIWRCPHEPVLARLLQPTGRLPSLQGGVRRLADALLLNHAELLLTQPFSLIVLRKLALNFAVPYLVSSYSAARTAVVVDAASSAVEPIPADD